MKQTLLAVFFTLVPMCFGLARAADVTVRDAAELRKALRSLSPGDTLFLERGEYGNGLWIRGLSGTKEKRIVIKSLDERNLPIFRGGTEAIHLVDCNYVTLDGLGVVGCTGNGINADDGGSYDTPSRGLAFRNITIEDIGPKGNRDGLKLSGLDDFVVQNCTVSGWGGSAIDMVGCHDGVISGCRFIGKGGSSQASGIQAKGGSQRILIERSFFKNAGQRAVNLGGSTGAKWFRPQGCDFEAKDLEVAGNHFVGSMAPVSYTTSVGCKVHRNTIVYPQKWVLRILQEQPTTDYKPCQGGVFEANLIVFDKRTQRFANVGPNTKPETFSFRGNAWFCADGKRRPRLPVKELNGIYGIDPLLENAEQPELRVRSTDERLGNVGAHAYKTR